MSKKSQISRFLRLKRSTIGPDTKPASAALGVHIPPKPATDNAVPVTDKPVQKTAICVRRSPAFPNAVPTRNGTSSGRIATRMCHAISVSDPDCSLYERMHDVP